MKITMLLTLQGAGCVKFDDDGACTIRFTGDSTQLPEAVKLLLMQGRVIKVVAEAQPL